MSQDPNPRKSGGMSGLMMALIGVGVLGLICAGACGGCIYMTKLANQEITEVATRREELKEPAKAAQNQISGVQVVKDTFGDAPIFGEPSREGNTQGELNTADARFQFPVSGNGKSGVAHVRAAREEGLWKINEVKITLDDGKELEVPVSGEVAPPDISFE